MDEFKIRTLEAEMEYKGALLEIENDEVKRLYDEITKYFDEYFEKEIESYRNRQQLFTKVYNFKLHVDNSRAIMEEIDVLKEKLGIKECEYI